MIRPSPPLLWGNLRLTSESLVKLREIRENRQSIGHRARGHVLRVQQGGYPEVLFGRPESQLVVSMHIVLVETVEVTANTHTWGDRHKNKKKRV